MTDQNRISDIAAEIREHALFLRELGVDELAVEISEAMIVTAQESVPLPKLATQRPEVPLQTPAPMAAVKRPGARLAALPTLGRRERLGIPFMAEAQKPEIPGPIPAASQLTPKADETTLLFGEVDPTLPQTSDSIETIRADIGDCKRCPLFSGRTQIVHSTGNTGARLMFVGEAPGADEDAQGFPFVGRAGQLLTKIIESIGFKREEVFIGNINRCRPPGNRQPTLAEAETCRPFLQREIAVVRPSVIVVLGNTAAQNLLNTKVGISKIRGKFQDYLGVKLMPTFHPAYLLRDPHKKREVWEDMKKVREYLQSQEESR